MFAKIMTPRQEKILKSIILEFMKTAQPVGSVVVWERYKIKASPATIRNDMSDLIKLGFLEKENFSSGRIPTVVGLRYFLENILSENELNYTEEMMIREELNKEKFQRDRLLRRCVELLATKLKYIAVAIASDSIYYAGISDILDYIEFEDLSVLKNLLSVIENYSILESIFDKGSSSDGDIKILIGEESGVSSFAKSSIVFTGFRLHRGEQGYIGVLGPLRMRYENVLPLVRYVRNTIEEAVSGW